MCGIYGEFRFRGSIDLFASFNRLQLMKHRGPDGFGFEHGDFLTGEHDTNHNRRLTHDEKCSHGANYFLGHRRLSIIDLNENAFQPMESADGMLSIVFNGEIYNHVELRRELEGYGLKFKTDHSDTEVILNAYAIWGTKCLVKLRGMFAFAILDRPNRSVFIVRDRIGKKPLYYEFSPTRFAFSSELLPLIHGENASCQIDQEALCFYMIFGYVAHPLSIIKGILKLAPATCAIVNLKKQKISYLQYWDITGEKDTIKKEKQFVEEVDELLSEAVALRLRADVPIAAFISGGTDSTLIVKKIQNKRREYFDLFAADFPQPERSEKRYIEQVAARYKQKLNLSLVDLSHMNRIKDIIGVFDEPFDGGSSIAIFDLFKKAKNSVKVVLTGDGGDEVFAGYPRYVKFPFRQKILHIVSIVGGASFASLMQSMGIRHRKIDKIIKFMRGDFISNFILDSGSFEMVDLVKDSLRSNVNQFSLFEEIRQRLTLSQLSPVKSLQYLELNTILPGRMMYKVDRFSMFHGVEARSPFLDHRLVEMAFTIPDTQLVNGATTKMIPKKLLENDFDKGFVYRPKQGFGNPLSHWFADVSTNDIFKLLYNQDHPIYSLLSYQKVHEYFPQLRNGYHGKHERELWRLIVLGHYLERLNALLPSGSMLSI